MSKGKSYLLTTLLMSMFFSILYIVTVFHPEAWKWYGIFFGILGALCFTNITHLWIRGGRR